MNHPQLARLGIEWDVERQEPYVRMDSPFGHLFITPPRIEDAPDVARILNIESVHKGTLSIPHPFPIKDVEDWVQRQIKASDMWTDVLCQAEMSHVARFGGFPFDTIRKAIHGQDSRIIGNITLQLDENRKPRAIRDISTPEPSKYAPGEMVSTQAIWRSGYYLDPAYSGTGITTAALHRMLRLLSDLATLFDPGSGNPLVRAAIWDDNIGSKRVLEKCGFQWALSAFEKKEKEGEPLPYTRMEWRGFSSNSASCGLASGPNSRASAHRELHQDR